MTYTPNVPQANQQISATQGPILRNFTFIQTDAQVDHVFNGNVSGVAEGVHQQANMPLKATDPSGALPTGVVGQYYVGGLSVPKYYNGTVFFINISPTPKTVIVTPLTIAASGTGTVALPPNSGGNYFLIPTAGATGFASGQWVTNNVGSVSDQLVAQSMTVTDPGLSLVFKASGSGGGSYRCVLEYFTP